MSGDLGGDIKGGGDIGGDRGDIGIGISSDLGGDIKETTYIIWSESAKILGKWTVPHDQ